MSHLDAPTTKLVATACACCRTPLADAKSIEIGMGPHCRAKHGFNKPDVEVDIVAVAAVLASVLSTDDYAELIGKVDSARKAANLLVHRIAVLGGPDAGTTIAAYVVALRTLGFVKLAGIIENRTAPVRIRRIEGRIHVEAPFSGEFINAARKIKGRRFVKFEGRKGGENTFAESTAREVFAALRACYPGTVAVGPKGLFRIEAA